MDFAQQGSQGVFKVLTGINYGVGEIPRERKPSEKQKGGGKMLGDTYLYGTHQV